MVPLHLLSGLVKLVLAYLQLIVLLVESVAKIDFLDVAISVQVGVHNSCEFSFALYRTFSFVPQYLAWTSDHRFSHRSNILVGESNRILFLSSHPHAYYKAMDICFLFSFGFF